jgi:DNA-binding transcriptional regulator GbsR (MarR family)
MTPKPKCPDESALRRTQDQFILEWERLSSSWGINRTMAQIHALLYVSKEPLDVNQIIQRLGISRGNASMNLRELMDWGIVRRYRRQGDRKDTYVSESEPWQMFIRVVRERKRREIDPTADAIRECLSMLPAGDPSPEAEVIHERLTGLLEVFEIVDAVYKQAFATDEALNDLKNLVRQ